MSQADDEDAARRYRAWCAVHDRRAHRRYCDQLDEELCDGRAPARTAKQVTYPMVYHIAPGVLYDEKKDLFYRR